MEKDVPVKTSDDILTPGKLNLFILGSNMLLCDFI